MGTLNASVIARYMIMPEILPRLRALFTSGFGHIAFLMAQIYFLTRLLPAGHAYLDPKNIGKFGIHHVIAQAANHLVLSRKNIDQIIIFILLLTGVVLLALQIAATGFVLLFGHAMADSLFVTVKPDKDIAFMLLDQIFGVGNGTENFFNSCVSSKEICPDQKSNAPFPWPFHLALQQLFRFYSTGILIIGTLIFLYFLVVVVVETAVTGHPFGQRFNNMIVPIRLVVAIGLLIPLNYGYNSGQYITFAAAKYGSGLATNAWARYNEAISNEMWGKGANPTGGGNLIGLAKPPDAAPIAEFMSLVHTCAFAYYFEDPEIKKKKAGLPDPASNFEKYRKDNKVKPYFVKNIMKGSQNQETRLALDKNTTYEKALEFFERGDIFIRFGRHDDKGKSYKEDTGQVEPTCGDVRIKVTDARDPKTAGEGYLGTVEVQKFFFKLILNLWFDPSLSEDYIDFAGRSYLKSTNTDKESITPCDMGCSPQNDHLPSCSANSGTGPTKAGTNPPPPACMTDNIDIKWKAHATNVLQSYIRTELIEIWNKYNEDGVATEMKSELLDYGWGGAGIWYNIIAQINGAFASAFFDAPKLDKYPSVMERVATLKKKGDVDIMGVEKYNPDLAADQTVGIEKENDPHARSVAIGLYKVISYWNKSDKNTTNTEKAASSGALESAMNVIFGTQGLFAMTTDNAHIHPLAQLVILGKGLVETTIRNMAGATLGAALNELFKTQARPLVEAMLGIVQSTAFIGLTAGIVLFYVLPFLPFIYFYFTVASWIKTIFEAMVGVPLWALAHLRLGGEGLPGDAASNGYFMIFEIFVRPVLSVIALIAGMIIFAAQVRVLNFIWGLVTTNVGGFAGDSLFDAPGDGNGPLIEMIGGKTFKRSVIDQFFFTVLYAMVVYVLATASFKLIDSLPDNILRWMGAGGTTFGDSNAESVDKISGTISQSGGIIGQQIQPALQGLGKGMGGAASKMLGGS